MRLRRRHGWGAALIALFALPVLLPKGLPGVEDPAGGFFAWFAGVKPLNPRLWTPPGGEDGAESPRERDLRRMLAELWEVRMQERTRAEDWVALRDTLELDRQPVALVARVLRSSDPSPSRRSILIDRGSEDGLAEGYPVVSGGALVGRLQIVRGRSSVVRLITDPSARFEVAVRTDAERRVTGFLQRRGSARGPEVLEVAALRLSADAGRILEHAPVLSSNADPLVPPGLLVGYVSEVSDPERDGFPTLCVRPAFDLTRSIEVLVLIPGEGETAVGDPPAGSAAEARTTQGQPPAER